MQRKSGRYKLVIFSSVLSAAVTVSALARGQGMPMQLDGVELAGTRDTAITASSTTIATTLSVAQTRPQKSLDDIAIELLNPVNGLKSLTSEYLHQPYQGEMPNADEQISRSVSITPSFPFPLANGRKIVVRVTVPMNFSEPTYNYIGNRRDFTAWRIRQEASTIPRSGKFFDVHDHMYDTSFDVAYGGVNDRGFIGMVGIAGVLPTSNDLSGGRRQYLLGAEMAVGKIFKRGIIGGWLSHLTNVADDFSGPKHNTSLTDLKLFFAYGIGNGWQVVSNSHITYDGEGEDDNKLLLPLGVGIAKTTRIGSVPVRFVVETQKFLESPEAFGPDWQLKFSMTAVDLKRSLF